MTDYKQKTLGEINQSVLEAVEHALTILDDDEAKAILTEALVQYQQFSAQFIFISAMLRSLQFRDKQNIDDAMKRIKSKLAELHEKSKIVWH